MQLFPLRRTPTILPGPSRSPQILVPQVTAAVRTPGIDLREVFNKFISAYGQYVIVQRLNMTLHCSHCWNEKLGEGDPHCAYCLGRGYQSVLERHVSRRVSSLSEHRTQLLTYSSPGDELIDEVFWFFQYNTNPHESDIVYEVTWEDPAMTTVTALLNMYQITDAFPFRAAGGRVEFWRTSAKSKPIDRNLIGAHLRRLASQRMQIPVDGILTYGAPA